MAGAAGPRSQVAEGVEGCVDDIRLPFADILVAQSQFSHSACPVVLSHHVGVLQQSPEYIPAFFRLQVQQDAAFATVDLVVAGHRGVTDRVVYLDNVGPELGQGPA